MRGRTLLSRAITIVLLVGSAVSPSKAVNDTYTEYRPDQQTWIVGNSLIQAAFQIDDTGRFRFRWLQDPVNRRLWRVSDASPSSPINLTVDGITLAADTVYDVTSYSFD